MPKLILVGHESAGEEGEGVLEELVVVGAIENRWLDIADQVLEEGTDDNVDDLADLQVDCRA